MSLNEDNLDLFYAIFNDNLSKVESLLNQKNDNNFDIQFTTLLHVSFLNPAIAKLLVKKGADLNSLNSNGDTPLHCAVRANELEVVCMLLYYGADPNVPNKENVTPFMMALKSGCEKQQEALLDYVDTFKVEKIKDNLVDLAVKHGSPYVEEIILRGGNVNQKAIENFIFGGLLYDNYKLFKLIWCRISNSGIELSDYCGRELLSSLGDGRSGRYFGKYLNFIVENSSDCIIQFLAYELSCELYSHGPLCSVLDRCTRVGNLDEVTKFICLLLQYGFVCPLSVKLKIFDLFGYCQLFKMLLHFDPEMILSKFSIFRYEHCSSILPTYLCLVNLDIKTICDTKSIQRFPHHNFNLLVSTMQYWANSSLTKLLLECIAFSKRDPPELSIHSLNLPTFPSLLELARDKSREYIVNKLHMSTSSQYYTYINHLNMPRVCKEVLTFERKLYSISSPSKM